MVTSKLPVTVGVPEMMPVVASTFKPAGNPLAAKEVGVSVAAI